MSDYLCFPPPQNNHSTTDLVPTSPSRTSTPHLTSPTKPKQQTCNIAFVKTHKTASTTAATILYRYGKRHNLNVANFDGHQSSIELSEAVTQVNEPYPKRKGWKVEMGTHYEVVKAHPYAGCFEQC